MRIPVLLIAALALALSASAQTTFTVTTTADAGAGSLRQALTDANANAGADVIAFAIPGTGPHTLAPTSALPTITDPVTVDGLTQSGAQCATAPATLQVVLDGENLRIEGDDSTVRGLVIRSARYGLWIEGSRNAVECLFIGTDPTGMVGGTSNRVSQALIELNGFGGRACTDNRIGGPDVSQRNVFGSSGVAGIRDSCGGTVYQGNFFGLNATGTAAPFAVFQPYISASSGTNTIIGGSGAGEGNAFARGDANGSAGQVTIESGRIQGNTFGTTVSGELLPDHEDFVLRGGPFGIRAFGDVLIGGVEPGAGNLFRGHAFGAIQAEGTVAILGNRMFDNDNYLGSGRDLALQIATGDAGASAAGYDAGAAPPPPSLTDVPALTSASSARVRGTLQAEPNQGYRIEAFADATCGLQRVGGARYILGAFDVTTDGSGLATFDETLPTTGVPADQVIAATATSIVDGSAENGVTSELSACEPFPDDPLLVDRAFDVTGGSGSTRYVSVLPGSFRYAVEYANARPGRDTVRFAIPTDLPGCDASGVCPVGLPSSFNVVDADGLEVTDALVINGLSQPGANCDAWPATLKVILDGKTYADALVFAPGSDGSVLRGVVAQADQAAIRIVKSNVQVSCSFIGTDASGTEAFGGDAGVVVELPSNDRDAVPLDVRIGGPDLADRNLISGSTHGVEVDGGVGNRIAGVRVENNWIGPNAAGEAGAGNLVGVYVRRAEGITLGGTGTDQGNWIAHNRSTGVELYSLSSRPEQIPTGVAILGNAIHGNDTGEFSKPTPAIALGFYGAGDPFALDNDADDADEGANRRQNTPVVASAGALGGGLEVTYRVDTDPANATYPLRVEFFEAEPGAPFAGGIRYLGHDVYTAADHIAGDKQARVIPQTLVVGGESIVATATDADGNTSEFSASTVSVGDEREAEDRQLELAVGPNPTRGAVSVRWTLPAAGAVDLRVFDALGREVAVLDTRPRATAGGHQLEWDASVSAPGVYVVRLVTESGVRVQRVTLVR